ncbi:trimeric intracellular cation channel family protein [Acidocella aminolytica]|nr:trimeric intracellular cation channel family protein [Acidocella aminolytica]
MHNYISADLIVVSDWVGTLAFALSGALLGVRKQFDLFGILFLSFVVAVTGGVMRDVLIGALPPAAVTNTHYFMLSVGAGLLTFFWYPRIVSLQKQILLCDMIGLALFSVIGTQKALEYGINPLMAAILGMLTGIGGGMARDVLAREIPFVLRADLYAIAALAAGGIVSVGHVIGLEPQLPMLSGAGLCIFLRLMAIYRGWRAPVPRWEDK